MDRVRISDWQTAYGTVPSLRGAGTDAVCIARIYLPAPDMVMNLSLFVFVFFSFFCQRERRKQEVYLFYYFILFYFILLIDWFVGLVGLVGWDALKGQSMHWSKRAALIAARV